MFCKLEIFGAEPPEVKWFKGFKDLSTDPRYKIWTDGDNNQAILGIEGLKQEDEGAYRCCINGGEENAAEGGVQQLPGLVAADSPRQRDRHSAGELVVVQESRAQLRREAIDDGRKLGPLEVHRG